MQTAPKFQTLDEMAITKPFRWGWFYEPFLNPRIIFVRLFKFLKFANKGSITGRKKTLEKG